MSFQEKEYINGIGKFPEYTNELSLISVFWFCLIYAGLLWFCLRTLGQKRIV